MNCPKCGVEIEVVDYGNGGSITRERVSSHYHSPGHDRCLRRQLRDMTKDRDGLMFLLSDALANCPESYSKPCLDVLRATVAKADARGGAK